MGRTDDSAMPDRLLIAAAALGAALGVSWILLGSIGWVLTGIIVPVALILFIIRGEWMPMGPLLLLNGAIALAATTTPGISADEFVVMTPRGETITVNADSIASSAAVILTAFGAIILLVTTTNARRDAARTRRLVAHRKAHRIASGE
jgi:hypothetical protein